MVVVSGDAPRPGARRNPIYDGRMSAGEPEERSDDRPSLVDHPAGTGRAAPTREAPHTEGAERRDGRRRAVVIGCLVLVIVAGGVALALTVFSGGNDAQAEYRTRLNTAMRDVVAANRSLSNALGRLRSGRSRSAERAVARAQSATMAARGAVNALTVPSGSEQLATNARRTLSREAAYLAGIKDALANPRGASGEQAQTLAANLTDALDVVAPTDADWSQSVSGTDSLTAWTRRSVQASQRARRRRAAVRNGASTGSSSAPSTPASSGTDCGGGVRAGPNTSCAFAFNVRDAYSDAPGSAATIEVFSPTTGETYTMSCAPAGNGITCSGGNDASVSIGG